MTKPKNPNLFVSIAVRPEALRRAKLASFHTEQTLVDFASDALSKRSLEVLKKSGVSDPVTA